MEYKNDELTEEELINVQGGFQHMLGNIHPFEDEHIYGENQKEKLQELKEQLESLEESKLQRKGR